MSLSDKIVIEYTGDCGSSEVEIYEDAISVKDVKEFIKNIIEYIESTPTPYISEIEYLAGNKLI